ncbi:hypothetical protein Nepgr_016877 [Nepenthes gracilis]|uniref:Uncharacterized protein n=1 Tax=Nepenthes gracilis TaxID=150966 RepID=A0AAD3SRG8_NEPGR|nr:hypothetical protein Nepgr_016877 [Nepenthes gracilis]
MLANQASSSLQIDRNTTTASTSFSPEECQQLLSFLKLQLDNKQAAVAVRSSMAPSSLSMAHAIQTSNTVKPTFFFFLGYLHTSDKCS